MLFIVGILRRILSIYSFLIISVILLDFIGFTRNSRVYYILRRLTDPVLSKFRIKIAINSIIIDLGPLLILLIIQYLDKLLIRIAYTML